jgi:two-component system LytT family response regulator
MSIRALIVDDESLARERLRELCSQEGDITVVGESDQGSEAVRQIDALQPDLLLLDVQMRGMDGFQVLQGASGARPQVIFATAHEQFALRAFEAGAVDYLLKPFDQERFRCAVRRVRERMRVRNGHDTDDWRIRAAVQETLRSLPPRPVDHATPRRIVVERDGQLLFVAQSDIDAVLAQRNYVKLRVGRETYTVRWTMHEAEATLDSGVFMRIHRSVIVNTQRIRSMERWFHGEYVVVLTNEQRLTSGRAYRKAIQGYLKNQA